MRESVIDEMIESPGAHHYNIYVYKGWTLREVQNREKDKIYDAASRKWVKHDRLRTTIVWGNHEKCGLAGFITITTGKASCHKCNELMPTDVFVNMSDAMEMMKSSMEEPRNDEQRF